MDRAISDNVCAIDEIILHRRNLGVWGGRRKNDGDGV